MFTTTTHGSPNATEMPDSLIYNSKEGVEISIAHPWSVILASSEPLAKVKDKNHQEYFRQTYDEIQ